MRLTVRFDPYRPAGMQWVSKVTDGWRVLKTWRDNYWESVALGLDDLEYRARERAHGEV